MCVCVCVCVCVCMCSVTFTKTYRMGLSMGLYPTFVLSEQQQIELTNYPTSTSEKIIQLIPFCFPRACLHEFTEICNVRVIITKM